MHCSVLLAFSVEAVKSKIIWARTVGIGAQNSVTPQKAEPILKNKAIQLPWKKAAQYLVA